MWIPPVISEEHCPLKLKLHTTYAMAEQFLLFTMFPRHTIFDLTLDMGYGFPREVNYKTNALIDKFIKNVDPAHIFRKQGIGKESSMLFCQREKIS